MRNTCYVSQARIKNMLFSCCFFFMLFLMIHFVFLLFFIMFISIKNILQILFLTNFLINFYEQTNEQKFHLNLSIKSISVSAPPYLLLINKGLSLSLYFLFFWTRKYFVSLNYALAINIIYFNKNMFLKYSQYVS